MRGAVPVEQLVIAMATAVGMGVVLAAMAAEGRPLPLGEIDKFLTLLSDIPGKVEILAGL